MYGNLGKDSSNWTGGVSSENEIERGSSKNKQFTQSILKRDNYMCQMCGLKSGDRYPDGSLVKIEMDHIKKFSDYSELRLDPDNCRTLCIRCHKKRTCLQRRGIEI